MELIVRRAFLWTGQSFCWSITHVLIIIAAMAPVPMNVLAGANGGLIGTAHHVCVTIGYNQSAKFILATFQISLWNCSIAIEKSVKSYSLMVLLFICS